MDDIIGQYEQYHYEIDKLRNTIPNLREKWKDPKYDKVGAGFNLDNRFNTSGKILVSLDIWQGTYGSSGSSTPVQFDENIFRKALISYLNANLQEVLNGMANIIEAAALKVRENAIATAQKHVDKLKLLGEGSHNSTVTG